MEAPAILVTGEHKQCGEVEKNIEGEKDEDRNNCLTAGEGLGKRSDGRRKSETPRWRRTEVAREEEQSSKGRKREERARCRRGDDRLPKQSKGTDEEGGRRVEKRGKSAHGSPSSSRLLGADLGGEALHGRQGRRKSEVWPPVVQSSKKHCQRHNGPEG